MSIYNSTTLPNLSYANTFGDWVVATNNLIADHDQFAANNYQKNTGTLYLNDPTLGLQVNSAVLVAGSLQVAGVGSSATIQNNLTVTQGQVYISNTTLGLTNAGQMNVGGILLALAPATSLAVSNNTTMGGYLNVSGNTNIANTLSVAGTTTIGGATTVSNTLTTTGATSVGGNLSATGNTSLGKYLTVNNDISAYNQTLNGTLTVGQNIIGMNQSLSGSLQVGGNFIINGTTVYNTNNFTINANTTSDLTPSYINVYRGSSGANASIKWDSANTYWSIKDVTNNNFYRIITTESVVDNLVSTSTGSVATANVANALNNLIVTNTTNLQNQITSNVNSLQAQITSNVNSLQTQITSNVNSLQAQITSNTTSLQSQISANVAYISGVDTAQNTSISLLTAYAQAGFNKANTGASVINGTSAQISVATSGTYSNVTTLSLSTFGPGAGSTGGSNAIPVVTLDATGRVSAISTATPAIAYTQVSGLATVAHSGAYSDLSGTPTNLNSFTNGPGYQTSSGSVANATNAYDLYTGGGNTTTFNWSGQSGQPTWLWGGSSQTNHYVYNPSNFSVNYSNSAGNITSYTINQSVGTGNAPSFAAVYAGAFYYSSDRALKTNIVSIENDIIDNLRGVEFDWLFSKKSDAGFIAQEVQEVLPEAVILSEQGTLSISLTPIVAHLVKKAQNQQQKINELEEKLNALINSIRT